MQKQANKQKIMKFFLGWTNTKKRQVRYQQVHYHVSYEFVL